MAQKPILIMLDKETHKQLHDLMNYSLKNEDGLIIYRLYEGETKQEWYRQVLRAGIKEKYNDFVKKKTQIENES